MRYLLAGCAAALACAGPALAVDCDLTAQTSSSGSQALYDPFAPQDTIVDLQILALNAGDANCTARFYVAPLSGQLRLEAPSANLDYRIDGQRSGGARTGAEYGPFLATVPPGGSQALTIRFSVPAQQIVPLGYYTANLVLRGEDSGSAPILLSGANPRLTLAVPSRVEMSISGTSAASLSTQSMAPASIHFADASAGQTGRVYVNVWANSGVLVSLTSENGGVMRNVQTRSLPPIAYSATFDGAALPLVGTQTLSRTPPMSVQGASYELAITLGDTSRNFAGRYRDRITVDVNAN
jgi:hypothetical protein